MYIDAGNTAYDLVYRAASSELFRMNMGNGNFTAAGDIISESDARVKENVETIDNALDKVSKLRGVTFNKINEEDDARHMGVIAQEVEAVLPEVVTEKEDGMKAVAYGNIVGVLIEAIKDLKAEIEELKKK
jgi:hypothetical protein